MEEELTPGAGVAELTGDPAPTNLLDLLAQKREEISQNKETLIPVPGYDQRPPILLARYRLLDGPELAQIADRARTGHNNRWDRGITMAVDTFVAACTGIFYDMGDNNPVPLEDAEGKPIEGYTLALAEALRFHDQLPDTALRNVVFGLFAGNDVAIAEHNARLNRWFANTSVDVSQDFLGNP